MNYNISASMLFSDTLVPDIFIKEYLPMLDGDSVKIYLYCLFLSQKKDCSIEAVKRIFGYDDEYLKQSFNQLANLGLISVKTKRIIVCDIKEKELTKYYRPRTSIDVGEKDNVVSMSARQGVYKHISDKFFSGQMAPSWYGEIDLWFSKYDFDDDVMFMLFQHCADHLGKSGKPLNKAYVSAVARNWCENGVKTSNDLEKYLAEYEEYKGVKADVIKKLRIKGNLTEYEEKVIHKWFFNYKYSFEVIELALKKSVSSRNASLSTYDRYLTEWFSNGLRTVEQVTDYEEGKKQQYKDSKRSNMVKTNQSKVPQKDYSEQRQYDDEFFKSLNKNVK